MPITKDTNMRQAIIEACTRYLKETIKQYKKTPTQAAAQLITQAYVKLDTYGARISDEDFIQLWKEA